MRMPLLFLSRIIDGISGGNITTAQAYIADVTPPANRAAALSIIGMGYGIGFMVGPLVGGELAVRYGYAAPALLAAGCSLASALLSACTLKEPVHRSIDPVSRRALDYYLQALDYFKLPELRRWLTIFTLYAHTVLDCT